MHFRLFHTLKQGMCMTLGFSALFIASTPAVHAQIVNGGFETPVLGNGGRQAFAPGSTIGAWAVLGNPGTSVLLVNTNYAEPQNGITAYEAQQGLQSIDLTGDFNQGTSIGVQQSVTTVNGQNYALSFYVGKAQSSTGSAFYSDPNAVADLSINGGTRTPFTNSNTGTSGFINWQQFTVNFTATGASTTIAFFNGTGSNSEDEVGLDNVQLAVAPAGTPEPGALSLLAGLGLTVGVFVQRRRRH